MQGEVLRGVIRSREAVPGIWRGHADVRVQDVERVPNEEKVAGIGENGGEVGTDLRSVDILDHDLGEPADAPEASPCSGKKEVPQAKMPDPVVLLSEQAIVAFELRSQVGRVGQNRPEIGLVPEACVVETVEELGQPG